ncbi:hypothetical protein AXG93_2550s1520 [Marchantia polymorpha subsp. ruderalis]|uniref:Uncharacterized protein n=1 Tax=Marchantia polymorpha subsp. ruderalis TaxID=1480154 RepID=A0A176VN20_MARPO|nr:hypothetical protein AXG93_2550s1520 [Marchantia polymorpha subsp. ruderalis]
MEEVLKTVNTDIIVAHTNYLYSVKELLSRVAHTSTSTGWERVQISEPLWAATAAAKQQRTMKYSLMNTALTSGFSHTRIKSICQKQLLINLEVIKELKEQVQELRYLNPIDIRNLIDYTTERKVVDGPTHGEIVQDLSTILVLEDEVEADDSQEYIPVKTTEAVQCASLLQQFWMKQDIVNHGMIAAIQIVKYKISIMRSSKLVHNPILEYLSKV